MIFSQKLLPHTCFPFSHWQIASDGIWENALEVRTQGNDEALDLWLKQTPQDVAIEAFFGDKTTTKFFFFGLRIKKLSSERQRLFIKALCSKISFNCSFEDLINVITKEIKNAGLHLPTQNILEHTPNFLELGAEGFWKSYGSLVVWREGQPKALSADDISEKAPQILKPFKRPIMLEYAWKQPVPMWLALPVSKSQGQHFIFDQKKYERVVEQGTRR